MHFSQKAEAFAFLSLQVENYTRKLLKISSFIIKIAQPDGEYYWLKTLYSGNHPFLTEKHLEGNPRSGTSGELAFQKAEKPSAARKNFSLGKNISGY